MYYIFMLNDRSHLHLRKVNNNYWLSSIFLKTIIFIISILGYINVDAASFDCNLAKAPIEIMICVDAELSELDDNMATHYFQLLDNIEANSKRSHRDQQRMFLSERLTKCMVPKKGLMTIEEVLRARECLLSLYKQRIHLLLGKSLAKQPKKVSSACPDFYGIELKKIPSGEFIMGNNNSSYSDESPSHKVHVDPTCLMKTTLSGDDISRLNNFFPRHKFKIVPNSVYDVQKRLQELNYDISADGNLGSNTKRALKTFQAKNRLDVTGEITLETKELLAVQQSFREKFSSSLNWNETQQLAHFLSEKSGYHVRLPTEAEWEFSARGGLEKKDYPWGNEDKTDINLIEVKRNITILKQWCRNGFEEYEKMFGANSSEKNNQKVSPNGYGLGDIIGEWQWTSSQYKPYPYIQNDGREDILDQSKVRVVRGGSGGHEFCDLRVSLRAYGSSNSLYSVRFVVE